MPAPALPAAFFLCALGAAAFAGPIAMPAGGLRPDGPADLAPHPLPSKTYNEFWTYQFLLEGGMQIQLNLSRANLGGLKDPVCGADLALMGFQGKNYFVAREYPKGNFAYDPGRSRLAVHERIFFEGAPPRAHRVFFATAKRGVDYFLDLTFEGMSPGAVWGDGVFRLHDGQSVGLFLHVPGAQVRGRLAVNGDTLEVRGFGWMDHSFQSHFATRLIDAGYRYVVTSGRLEGGCFFRNKDGVFGYGVRKSPENLRLLKPTEVKAEQNGAWARHSVPAVLRFEFEETEPTRFVRKENRQHTSALQELGRMERFGARMVLGGEIHGFRGLGTAGNDPALFSFTLIQR